MAGAGRVDDRKPRVDERDFAARKTMTPRPLIVRPAVPLGSVHARNGLFGQPRAELCDPENARDATHSLLPGCIAQTFQHRVRACARSRFVAPHGPTGPTSTPVAPPPRASPRSSHLHYPRGSTSH